MYRIYQDGKLLKKAGKYSNYDDARNAARRLIRNSQDYDSFMGSYGNPVLRDWGMTIKQA